jgi:hypothetical protein
MKKVGIITIHNSPNYGACLQSYALYRYIQQQGNDVEIIDLHRPFAYEDYIPSKKYVCSRPVKRSLLSKLKGNVKSLIGIKTKNPSLYSPLAIKKFDEFNSIIKLSKPYRGIDELYANPPLYDLYISGSDQLWNPTQAYCLEPYFLTFVPNGQGKKISYATSVGITDLRDNEKKDFAKWLNLYDDISVREYQAQSLLQGLLADKKVNQVADPTFLLDPKDWKDMAVRPKQSKYILMFTLQHRPEILEYCLQLSKQSGLPLIELGQVQPDVLDGSYTAVKDAGPKEFLGYIENAELVITDSFHCTVFSLIMGANNFYTYIAPTNQRGSRIIDLLETYNLKKHLLPISLNSSFDTLMFETINKNVVSGIMKNERDRSRLFINQYL